MRTEGIAGKEPFNSRPHKEADPMECLSGQTISSFNSRPHKEADDRPRKDLWGWRTFNSRPHKEADNIGRSRIEEVLSLSTHGLTRRPTQVFSTGPMSRTSFNSRPHKEADRKSLREMARIRTFNSRPHKEADRFLNPDGRSGVLSTHGLTRRPTPPADGPEQRRRLSTHGLTRRPTPGLSWSGRLLRHFQLTASQGGRLIIVITPFTVSYLSTHGLTRRPTMRPASDI